MLPCRERHDIITGELAVDAGAMGSLGLIIVLFAGVGSCLLGDKTTADLDRLCARSGRGLEVLLGILGDTEADDGAVLLWLRVLRPLAS